MMKRVSLELGGNARFIVFDDADVGNAVDAVMASEFRLSGQTVVRRVGQFKFRPGCDSETTIGPLITPQAAVKVQKHVADIVAAGGKVLIGGMTALDVGECFYQPTVLGDVSSEALCAKEETFGPLLPMIKFQTEDEVIRVANSVEVGLAGYFFTENSSRAWRVAEALEVGMVINLPP
ncbi:hypothetical protein IFR05_015437 [Cadophora sp. M221]|nr:hypothetical protein IFR05_015437 [Cadophora sp. M221]